MLTATKSTMPFPLLPDNLTPVKRPFSPTALRAISIVLLVALIPFLMAPGWLVIIGVIAAAITIISGAIVAARFVIDVLTTDVNELTEQITQLTAQQTVLTRQRTGLNAELSYNTIVYNNEESVIASLIEDENALIAEIIKLDKKIREAVSGSIIESLITVRDEKMGRLTSLLASITRRIDANLSFYETVIVPLSNQVDSVTTQLSITIAEIGAKETEKAGKITARDLKNAELEQLERDLAAKREELRLAREAEKAEREGGDND